MIRKIESFMYNGENVPEVMKKSFDLLSHSMRQTGMASILSMAKGMKMVFILMIFWGENSKITK